MCAAHGADEMNDFFKSMEIEWWMGPDGGIGCDFGGYLVSHYFIGSQGDIAHISA